MPSRSAFWLSHHACKPMDLLLYCTVHHLSLPSTLVSHASAEIHHPTGAALSVQAERNVVEAMTQCQKPDMAGLQQLVTPVGAQIQAADKLTQVGSTLINEKTHHQRESAQLRYCCRSRQPSIWPRLGP